MMIRTEAKMDSQETAALLTKLRESRLSSEERRTALDTLRKALETSDSDELFPLVKTTIEDGPNDVRRVALQTLSHRLETDLTKDAADDPARAGVEDLVAVTESFLRTTLKIQSSRSSAASSRITFDISTLPTSALRAIAAALKTLHALIPLAPKKASIAVQPAAAAGRTSSLLRLFDILLPCLSAGSQLSRSTQSAIPRPSSSLQAGAFSWSNQPRSSRNFAASGIRTPLGSSASTSTLSDETIGLRAESQHIYSSAGETDRKSDKSESERSDFSTASTATSLSRSRKDESRQQEASTKLIRQNALHCLIELNSRESRALISRWSDLLPNEPAPIRSSDAAAQASSTTARFAASASSPASFSLCTLLAQDPSTSVRLAAMSTLESILSHGTLQLSLAQERAQRALSFTSLSSQLASWIVNIRSYLVVALQRTATAPRTSSRSEPNATTGGYPSSLTTGLLQLTRTFVNSTSKARLVTSNDSVLGPLMLPFASHSDPQVQAAAKQAIASLTAPTSSAITSSATRRTELTPSSTAGKAASGAAIIASSQPAKQRYDSPVDILSLLADDAEATSETCERVLAALEADGKSADQTPIWALFVKKVANAPGIVFGRDKGTRLWMVWQRLTDQARQSPESVATMLGTVADMHRMLLRSGLLDGERSTLILEYVQRHCADFDETIRAAAVRVLGLLVLPSDSDHIDTHHQQICAVLDDVLWGDPHKVNSGTLQDSSSLVRQRASWAFSNAMEARVRAKTPLIDSDWTRYARYCLEAAKDIEGVAVSAYRTSGSLLALLDPALATDEACSSLGRSLLEQLCRVLGTTSKPPKSRWNAASALDRALGSDVVTTHLLGPSACGGLVDRIVDSLCSSLIAKVLKIRVSAANALVSLCLGAAPSHTANAHRLELLGGPRAKKIRSVAVARLAELGEPATSREAALYVDELKRLLETLVATIPA